MQIGPGQPTLLNKPRARSKAVRLMAEGEPAREVAKQLGVSARTVYRWENKDDIKKEVQEESVKLLTLSKTAVDTYKRILDDAAAVEVVPHLVEYEIEDPEKPGEMKKVMVPADPKVIANNVKLLTLAGEKSRDILQTAGILAAQAEARMVVNIFAGDSVNILSPLVGSILGALGPASPEQPAIDAEYEEVDENPESGDL